MLFSELMVLITSKNRPGYFWAVDEGTEGYLMRDAEQFRITSPGTELSYINHATYFHKL